MAERFDIGVRLGGDVAKDMIAVRIAPDMRLVVVGSPNYLERHAQPRSPQDLTEHDCIGLRLPSHGGLLPGGFKRRGKSVNARVTGRLVFPTPATWSSPRRWPDMAWRGFPTMLSARTSPRGDWSRYWMTGRRPSPEPRLLRHPLRFPRIGSGCGGLAPSTRALTRPAARSAFRLGFGAAGRPLWVVTRRRPA